MKIFFVPVLLTVFLLSSFKAPGQSSRNLSAISDELNKMKSLGDSIRVGFSLFDDQGHELLNYNANQILAPASTLKIYTTGAALALLGSQFKYKTYLEFEGAIDECGELNGNIILRGSGDPTLGSERIEGLMAYPELINMFADEIKKAGITKVQGNIIGDDTHFNDCLTPSTWPLKDVANYFGAGPSGLNLNENSYKLIFKPGIAVGSKTDIIGTSPPSIPLLYLRNKVTTYRPGSGDRAVIMENPATVEKEVIGTIPAGVSTFTIRGALPNPALLAAQLLKEKLEGQDIIVTGKPFSGHEFYKSAYRPNRLLLFVYHSPPLIEIVRQTNMRSHNLFAETLMVTLGKEFRKAGNYDSGFSVVKDFWVSKGVNLSSSEIFDGSGLSPCNLISPHALSSMLSAYLEDDSFEPFLKTLPIAGVSGTVKRFCANTSAKGKVYVKSGSIENVLSYSGYAKSKSGKFLPFTVMVNGHGGKRPQVISSIEKIMVILTNHL